MQMRSEGVEHGWSGDERWGGEAFSSRHAGEKSQ